MSKKLQSKTDEGQPGSKKSDKYDLSASIEAKIDPQALETITMNIRQRDQYVLEETDARNVLMVGRTRSGKTTAVGVIKDLCYQPKMMSIFSDTVNPKFQSFALLNKDDKVKMTLNMIDTPGVFEVKSNEAEARTNEMIVKVITQCSQNEITKLHCVVIFASFETGINPHDIDAISMFMGLLEGANIILCITRAEMKPASWRENLKKDITSHGKIKIHEDQIFFMGCYDANTSPLTNEEDVINCYRHVNEMRTRLLKKFSTCNEPAQIRGLRILNNKVIKMKEYCTKYVDLLKKIQENKDQTTGPAKLMVQEIYEIQKLMGTCIDIADNCQDEISVAHRHVQQFRLAMRSDPDLCDRCTFIFNLK